MIDLELKSHFDEMEERLAARLEERLAARLTVVIGDLLKPIIAVLEILRRELRKIREILERREARFNDWQAINLQADKASVVPGKRMLALEERAAKIERLIRKEA